MTTPDEKANPPEVKEVRRDALTKRVVHGSAALNPKGRPVENWRQYLRAHTNNGDLVWQILLQLAEGKPRTLEMKDGRQATVIPTPEVQVRAAIHLSEMLFGKAVTQNEQMKAEREASDMEAVRALSQEQLEARARAALNRMGVVKEAEAEVEEGVDASQAVLEVAPLILEGRSYAAAGIQKQATPRSWAQLVWEGEEGWVDE